MKTEIVNRYWGENVKNVFQLILNTYLKPKYSIPGFTCKNPEGTNHRKEQAWLTKLRSIEIKAGCIKFNLYTIKREILKNKKHTQII